MRCVHFLLLFLGLTVALVSSVEQDFDDSEAEVEVEENDLNDDEEIDIEDEIQTYESPTPEPGKYHLADHFDDISQFEKRWIKSQAKKDDIAEEIAKYDGEWNVENPQKQIWKNDLGLVLKSKAKHAAISSRLVKPFVFEDKPLIVQYEVTMQDGQECGGSYMKLLSLGKDTQDLTKFNDKTPYTIMFGPDKCGNDVKLHFIFRHVNPVNGTITEKHCRKPKDRLEEPFKDKLPHLYQLVINPDNTFQIRVDHNVLNEGSLLTEFTPPVNPPKEINDPEDKKPENWDEREKIPDPDSTKPDDWDEDEPPQVPDINAAKPNGWLDDEEVMIPDPNAKKPEDWDTDMDGEWEAPLIENPICEKAVGCGLWKAPLVANPEYKGKWRAPLIENPNYQGKWIPRKIPNPDFFEDLRPFKMTTITAVGFELWSMSSEIYFDNILITDNIEFANDWAASTFDLKRKQIDKSSESLVNKVAKLTNKYPWLWGVLVIIVGIPLSFILYTFCFKKEKATAPSHPKKTDEPTQDDDDDDVDDDEPTNNSKPTEKTQIGEEDAENLKQKTSPKSKKSDLEVNENDDNIENIEDNDEDDDVEDVEEDIIEDISDDNEEEIEKSSTTENTTEGTRKRNKPRKE